MKGINGKSLWVLALLVAAAGLPATQGALPGSKLDRSPSSKSPGPSYMPDELLVKFKAGVGGQARAKSISGLGLRPIRAVNQSGWMHFKLPAGVTMAQAMSLYAADPNVEYVQPNYIYRIAAAPNDPRYSELWAFKNVGQTVTSGPYAVNPGTLGSDVNIEPAWDHITDCSNVVVAVIDSGVNYDQEDLAVNMWNGGAAHPDHGDDFIDDDADPMDLNGHGTHVAGIIGAAGNNSLGTTGVCWKASIMAVRVLDAMGVGTTASIIQGVNFAVTNGAKVINMSIGGNGAFDPAFSAAISSAQASDVVVVVAAGNSGADNDAFGSAVFPCNFTHANIVCVAALDQNYALASFSNWGATSVDVGAPGTNILSTWAGTQETIPDNFKDVSGALSWTTSSGWDYGQVSSSGGPVDALVNPFDFPNGTYSNMANERVYNEFDLSLKHGAVLNFFARFALQPGDFLAVAYRAGGGDLFTGGVVVDEGSGSTGGFFVGPFSYDISACTGALCSVGFQLLTDASGVAQGVGIASFSIDTLQLNPNSYQTINGTSMATPYVAGLAAMLRAYNPQYTYPDVVNAIKNGGRAMTALADKTTSGRAVDAMGGLAYINPPTGVTASVQ